MTIYIGADHRGYLLKQSLIAYLQSQKYEVVDCGNFIPDEKDDYPDFALPVAKAVSEDTNNRRGIVICGSGVGVSIAANKVVNIRAGLLKTIEEVVPAVQHDNINILALGADHVVLATAEKMIDLFLTTKFTNEERHVRRLAKIGS